MHFAYNHYSSTLDGNTELLKIIKLILKNIFWQIYDTGVFNVAINLKMGFPTAFPSVSPLFHQ